MTKCGVHYFRLYDLRHTWATRAVQNGMDLATVAAILGHTKLNMLMQCAHPKEDNKADTLRKLARANAVKVVAAFERLKTTHPHQGKTLPLVNNSQTEERKEAPIGFEPMHKGFGDQLETHGWSATRLQWV